MAADTTPLTIAVVGWHSHDEMFDAIAADLRAAALRGQFRGAAGLD